MKVIKLTGRERTVLRAIDFANGTPGTEILQVSKLSPEDLVDILNGLTEVGFIEPNPYTESITVDDLATHSFDVNPSYALELRKAMQKAW